MKLRPACSREEGLTGPYRRDEPKPMASAWRRFDCDAEFVSPALGITTQQGNAFDMIGLGKHIDRLHLDEAVSPFREVSDVPR